MSQAEALDKVANIDCVINIAVDPDLIVNRITGRRMCACGESYHISMGIGDTCPKCGAKLYQRDDDKEETVVEAVKSAGLEVLEIHYQGEWVSVIARKN